MAEVSEDRRRILITNLPNYSSEDLVTNYLEIVTQYGVTALDYRPELLPGIGLVTLDEDVTDEGYELAVQKTSQRLLSGQHVVIKRVAKATGILLHDVPLPHTTEDYLELYFDKLLNSVDGTIRQVAVHADIRKAIILFNSSDVVEHILQQKIEINKTKVKVELYYPEFHEPILESQSEERRMNRGVEVDDVVVEMNAVDEVKCAEEDVSRGAAGGEERQNASENRVKRLTQHFEKEVESSSICVQSLSPRKHRSVEMSDESIVSELQNCQSTAADAGFFSERVERPTGGKQWLVDLTDFISSPTDEKTMENVPRNVGCPPTVPPKPRKDGRRSGQGDLQTGYSRPQMSTAKSLCHWPQEETEVVREAWPSVAKPVPRPRQTVSQDTPCLGVRSNLSHSETAPNLQRKPTESWQEERGCVAIHDLDMPNNRYVGRASSESDVGEGGRPAQPLRIVDMPKDSEKSYFREHTNGVEETQTPLDIAPVVSKEMTVDRHKLELLCQAECLKDLQCPVVMNEETGTLRFEGTEAQIRSSQLKVFETISSMEEISVKLPHSSLVEIIKHERSSLQAALKNHRAVICVRKDQVKILGMSKKEMKQAETALQKMVISDSVTLDPSHITFTQSEEWRTFVQKKQNSGLVRIITVLEKKMVYVNGMSKEVSLAEKEILSTLKQNATVVKTIKVNNPKGKFLYFQCKYQLFEINNKLRSKKVQVRVKSCGRDFTEVESRGLKDVVDEGEKEVKKLEQGLAQFTVDIPFSVTKTKIWRTFSTGSNFNTWIEYLEKSHKCCIQPCLSKTSPPRKMPRSSGRRKQNVRSPGKEGRRHTKDSRSSGDRRSPLYERRQSPDSTGSEMAPLTLQCGPLKIVLKAGDITQEKADVLVNGISSSLDLTQGQVAKKFLQKAGQQMQQALSRAGQTGFMSAGEVVETPGGGQLQCKAVMHVVLERYRDASSIQALRDGVSECLKKSSGHTSLSLPTLGCGHLRYPNTPTAKAIVNGIKQFGQSATSSLRVVTIVVFDQTLYRVFKGEFQPNVFSPMSTLPALPALPGMFLSNFSNLTGARPKRPSDSNKGYHRSGRRRSGRRTSSQGDITSEPVKFTVQNTTVIIKQGNIVQENADVLVNVTNRDLDLSRGKVSQSFLKAGGEELQDEVSLSGKAKDGDVVVVPSCGSLQGNSKHIANVVVPRYNQQYGLRVIEKVIKGCLEKAVKEGVTSVAFPSLGCGKLSYPRDQVARAMMKEIRNFAQNSSALKTVKIVIYEADVFAVFAQTFKADDQDASDGSEEDSNVDEVNDDGDTKDSDDEEDVEDEENEDNEEEEGISGAAASAAGPGATPPSRQSKRSHFVVVTLSENVKETKQRLTSALEEKFCCETLDMKKYISDKAKATSILNMERKHLEGVANEWNVEVQIEDKALSLDVQGSYKNVSKAVRRMMEILLEKSSNFDEGQHIKKHGTFEERCEYQRKRGCEPPDYWDTASLTAWKKVQSLVHDNVLAKPSQSVEAAIRTMITSTWQARYVGVGRDSRNIKSGTTMNIKKIELIQNHQLFHKYFNCRQQFFSKVMKKEICPIGKIKGNQPDIQTNKYLTKELGGSFEKEVNEVYLFHGTQANQVKGICSNGIDFRLANDQGMLGKGIYCAESSTKADQYTGIVDDQKNRVHKDLKMVVARVALGRIYLCEDLNPAKFNRPPCVKCFQDKCDHSDGLFDSVVFSHSQKNFREFVVYHNEQCYPEFLVTYDRV